MAPVIDEPVEDQQLDATGPEPTEEPDRLAEPVDGEQPPRLAFPVIGMGASAGGLEAYSDFFKAMAPDSGMAFVLIQHLPPERESMMAEILAKRTEMPVREVVDGVEVEANHVYVIRPGHTLTIKDGRLHLGEPLEKPGHRRPVDDFFRSLAEEQRERAVCVIMSGMGSNGTAGAQAIKAVGGVCIAQEPESAKFPSMPRALIDSGLADFVLRPPDVSDFLLRYSTHPYVRGRVPATLPRSERQHLQEVFAILRTRTRHSFDGYKKPTVLRRIQRRMGLHQVHELAEYVRLLRQSTIEVSALADDLMIHVTGFFRDADAWQALYQRVVVPLAADRDSDASIRAWVTACSSGEEAYTLAMLLVEAMEAAGKQFDIKVFATDTADRTLSQARGGVYPGGIEGEITPERLQRFFDKDDSSYRVKQELRELVVFAPQNVLQDPPFSRLDICTCRNLLIYLEPEMQRRVLALLHFGIREGGALFLGNSETVAGTDELFEPLDKRWRIFRRVGPTRHGSVDFVLPPAAVPPGLEREYAELRTLPWVSIAQVANKALLQRYTPPSVVVDRQLRIVYFHGSTERFLSQPAGEPTRELLSLARDGVRGAVRAALHQAMTQNERVTVRDGLVESEAGNMRIEVTVAPLDHRAAAGYFLVSFTQRPDIPVPPLEGAPREAADAQRLEDELRRVRDELQSAVEELQTSNEEMKASNEETTSINEELQSTNEELETSKEELQSLNEELTTVNAQLHTKMEELEATTSDLASLLSSTEIGVVFLDTQFCIRRFTPAVKDLFDLIPADVGRPLNDLARKFEDPELLDDARAVLDRLVPVEKEIQSESGKWYMRRVLPYRTGDHRIGGVVVTFVDISRRRQAERDLQQSHARLQAVLDQMPAAVILAEPSGRITFINKAVERVLGYAEPLAPGADGYRGWPFLRLDCRPYAPDETPLARAIQHGETVVGELMCFRRPDSSQVYVSVNAAPIRDAAGNVMAGVLACTDMTEQRRAAEVLHEAKEAAEAANHAKDRFLAMVSHELRTPLSAIALWTKVLSSKGTSPEQFEEAVHGIEHGIQAQKRLIEDLIDTARIATGKFRLDLQPLELSPIVAQAIHDVRPTAQAKGIAIHEQLATGVGVVLADADRLDQVVSNLLANAVKFTPPKGDVTVRLSQLDHHFEIQVADTGQGIAPELLPHVFAPFRQSELSNTRRSAAGLGLGLAIAKQIVEMHGGSIDVASPGLGQGTTATVTLPLVDRADPMPAVRRGPQAAAESSFGDRLPGLKILVVEDDDANRKAAATLLRGAGALVVAVETAELALAEWEKSRPDVMIADIGLPGMDGYALLREIRRREAEAQQPPLPAIALTALSGDRDREAARSAGYERLLGKPPDSEQIIQAMEQLRNRR
ncbi:MAG TPA: chemotaxis protein CheB [Pirellulales bacterium]|nr:chemotaxis protein CheB [Pirellulales bacterium]